MQKGLCLRIYLSESEQIDHVPALDAVLQLCQDAGLDGVSIMRGVGGIGSHGKHSSSLLALSSHLPLMIEVIDQPQRIEHAIAMIKPKLKHGSIATWPVDIVQLASDSDT